MIRAKAITLIAVVSILASACGVWNGRTVDEALTAYTAAQKVIGLLTESLGALRAGTSLTSKHPTSPNGTFSPGSVGPCYDGNTDQEGPVLFGIWYWVSGVPDGSADQYLQVLVNKWENEGWSITDRSRSDTKGAMGESGDGYRLTAKVNVRGSLSIIGVSPCFPRANSNGPGNLDTPDTIEHP